MSKQDRALDLSSSIDEEIVERNLKRRFLLWNNRQESRKKPNRKAVISIAALAACLCLVVGIVALVGGGLSKQAPVYQGMTVSNNAPSGSQPALSAPSGTMGVTLLSSRTVRILGSENTVKRDDTLSPEDFNKTYYATKNEDIYIYVHLKNPDDFEILSFTLNGKKYSSNMFEDGSDMETLILKYNVGDVDGLQQYTIDAIKYIDGERIKNVKMEGNDTVKVMVNDDTTALQLNPNLVGFDLYISPSFASDFTGEKTIRSLALYQGDTKLRDLPTDTRVITDLPEGQRLILKATYLQNGAEETTQYIFDSRAQSEGLNVSNGVITGIGSCTDDVLYLNMPIAEYAFGSTSANYTVKEVYIGPGCSGIGASNFLGWGVLERIVFQAELEELPDYILQAVKVEEVILPRGLKTIGTSFCWGSENLTAISIPASVTSIAHDAFTDCHNLTDITFGGTKAQWNAIEKGHFWSSKGKYTVHCTDGSAVIYGNIIDGIYHGNWGDYNSTSIVIPDGVIGIADYAFSGYGNLTSIVIPNSVTSIGSHAFYGCTGLTSITIPDSVTSIGDHAFNGCTGLTSITIPDSVTSIGKMAFAECENLTSVTIGKGVTSIDDFAFSGCNNLTDITFGGTKAQWNKIKKSVFWIESRKEYTVHCSDGDIYVEAE